MNLYGQARPNATVLKKNPVKEIYQHNSYMLVDYFESSEFIHIKLPTTESIKKMPLEQFDGEQIYDDDPLIKLEKGSLRGFSKYRDLNIGTEISEPEWRDCEILFYDQLNKRFTIKWLCNGKKKEVRSQLIPIFFSLIPPARAAASGQAACSEPQPVGRRAPRPTPPASKQKEGED